MWFRNRRSIFRILAEQLTFKYLIFLKNFRTLIWFLWTYHINVVLKSGGCRPAGYMRSWFSSTGLNPHISSPWRGMCAEARLVAVRMCPPSPPPVALASPYSPSRPCSSKVTKVEIRTSKWVLDIPECILTHTRYPGIALPRYTVGTFYMLY